MKNGKTCLSDYVYNNKNIYCNFKDKTCLIYVYVGTQNKFNNVVQSLKNVDDLAEDFQVSIVLDQLWILNGCVDSEDIIKHLIEFEKKYNFFESYYEKNSKGYKSNDEKFRPIKLADEIAKLKKDANDSKTIKNFFNELLRGKIVKLKKPEILTGQKFTFGFNNMASYFEKYDSEIRALMVKYSDKERSYCSTLPWGLGQKIKSLDDIKFLKALGATDSALKEYYDKFKALEIFVELSGPENKTKNESIGA